MTHDLPPCWAEALAAELDSERHAALCAFVAAERAAGPVWPAPGDVYRAFALTPLARVRVIVVGQDPYHGPGQATGLAFSVPAGARIPPSLSNIFRELAADRGCRPQAGGDLSGWARQGVLLINTCLTVREGQPGSHRGRGWEELVRAAIGAALAAHRGLVVVAWGAAARRQLDGLDLSGHHLISSAHPSPLSARRGFLGSRPFSAINAHLRSAGRAPIDWGPPT